jgi:ABC-type multidrug transport system permease subunit
MSNTPDAAATRNYHPLLSLAGARLKEFVRKPEAVFWVYFFPLIMVGALGVAFRNRPPEQFVAVIQDGPLSDSIAAALEKSERFEVHRLDEVEGLRQLRTGRADLRIVGSDKSGYEYSFDPTRPNSAIARDAADDLLQRAAGREDVMVVENQELTAPGGRYIDFLVPGLLGMGLMGGGLWGVGFAIVDLRIRKLLKRYLATPMRRSDFLASVMISRLLFTVPEVILLLVFSSVFFGVAIQGSYFSLCLLLLLGALEFSGIGLLVASRANTLETVSGLMNLVMLPMWIVSGIFFSRERFPDVVQPLIQLLPLTPLIDALRSVMLDGASLIDLSGEITIMTVWLVVTFSLALRLFRWS